MLIINVPYKIHLDVVNQMSKADIKQHDYCVFKHLGQGAFFALLIYVSLSYNLNKDSSFDEYCALSNSEMCWDRYHWFSGKDIM